MKVLHVIPSIALAHGGPSVALRLMARGLAQVGVQVDIATTDDDGPGRHLDTRVNELVEGDGLRCFFFAKQTEAYKTSWPLARWLYRHVSDYDLVHIHALFSFSSGAAAAAARRKGVPYVVRPLGVLNRWGIENRRRWLKQASLRLIERPILRAAKAVHYTALQEQTEAEASGIRTRGVVIPLGIDVAAYANLPDPAEFYVRHPIAAGRPLVLFLSRVDRKKGLDLLLPAFAQATEHRKEAILVIAGVGEDAFVAELRRLADSLDIADRIIWTGFIEGREKLAALAAASVFVLPSYSENFGLALVEALAAGLPCILTEPVGVSGEVREARAGVVVPCDVSAIGTAIDELLSDGARRSELSRNARLLAAERFSSGTMSLALLRLYEQVVTEDRRDNP